MGIIKPLRFWGYLDDQGMIHVKHYRSDWDIQKCEQMPFCRGIFEPFEAWDRAEAMNKCRKKLNEIEYEDKKSKGKLIC